MTVTHAPDELLLDYASGALSEPMALVVGTHLALAPESRKRVAELEEIGGAMLNEVEAEPIAPALLDDLLSKLDDTESEILARPAESADNAGIGFPEPLRSYIAAAGSDQSWTSRGPLEEMVLLPDYPGVKTRLLRIRPGAAMPAHTHEGRETTLVLQGGFTDESGHYRRGDIALADHDVDHQPVADDDEVCICLAVSEGRLKLTGPVGRWLNPFIRI